MSDLAGDGPGNTGSSSFSLVRFQREIFPFLQCTQWVPSEGAGERDRLAGAYDIVVPRGMLEGIRREAKKHPEGDCVGVFYGVGCECPWTRRLWVRVDSTIIETPPAREGLLRRRPTTVDGRPIGERLAALLDGPQQSPGTPLGWFRTRQTNALVMFDSESETFKTRFREPWQFSVLLPAPGTEGGYGVFGRDEDGSVRDALARPFYEHEETRNGRDRKPVVPVNYHRVERATELPGSTGAWREVQRRKAPALVTAACMIFGVAGGLALSYELSRASQPGGFLGDSPVVFASPAGDLVGENPGASLQGLVAVLDGQVAVFNDLIDRPADASTYCQDLQAARDGVHGAFLTLIRRRDELSADTASEEIERAIQEKGRVDTRFERADCAID